MQILPPLPFSSPQLSERFCVVLCFKNEVCIFFLLILFAFYLPPCRMCIQRCHALLAVEEERECVLSSCNQLLRFPTSSPIPSSHHHPPPLVFSPHGGVRTPRGSVKRHVRTLPLYGVSLRTLGYVITYPRVRNYGASQGKGLSKKFFCPRLGLISTI